MSITSVSNENTGFTIEEAEDLVVDLICSGDISPLRQAILTSELVAVVVARLLKHGDSDEFPDHRHTVAQWVREADHGGESIAITDELWIESAMAKLWLTRDEAEALVAAAKETKE